MDVISIRIATWISIVDVFYELLVGTPHEKMSDIDGKVENVFAAKEAEKVGVKIDQPPKRKRMRSHKSLSQVT